MDIITLGIGPGSSIADLVLTGLAANPNPEPPVPEVSETGAITPSVAKTILDVDSENDFTGETFPLPGVNSQVTWQVIFASAPATASVIIQISLDGFHWFTVDSSSEVGGEVKTFITSAKFIRAGFGTMEEGINTKVKIVASSVRFVP